jgi:hypothetical protein
MDCHGPLNHPKLPAVWKQFFAVITQREDALCRAIDVAAASPLYYLSLPVLAVRSAFFAVETVETGTPSSSYFVTSGVTPQASKANTANAVPAFVM